MSDASPGIPRFASVGLVAYLAGATPQTVRNYVASGLIQPSGWVHRSDVVGPAAIFGADVLTSVVNEVRRLARAGVRPPVAFRGVEYGIVSHVSQS